MTELVATALISAAISLVASMLGLGGAVLLIPALLYLPPVFGVSPFGVATVSGMTPIIVLSTSLLSVLLHGRRGTVSRRIVLVMGVPIVFSSLAGAWFSGSVRPDFLIIVFALMAVTGSALLVIKKEDRPGFSENTDFRAVAAAVISVVVGFFGGMAGAPGAFILSPLMMTVLGIPTRITIGSTLGIVLMASASTSVGKILAGGVRFDLAVAGITGSIPGAIAGASLSHRLQTTTLRNILAVLIAIVGIAMLLRTLTGMSGG
ncbi:MAG TPA: sulfite exporter TauE/SafE family protein [Bacteroidota bacterium]|nr:sulfite exporter TauE/SafE family protein [Bacteroidota bacterium]